MSVKLSKKEKEEKPKTLYRFRPTVDAFAYGEKYSSGKKNGRVRFLNSPFPVKPNKHFIPVGVVRGDNCIPYSPLDAVNKEVEAKAKREIKDTKEDGDLLRKDFHQEWHDQFDDYEKKLNAGLLLIGKALEAQEAEEKKAEEELKAKAKAAAKAEEK